MELMLRAIILTEWLIILLLLEIEIKINNLDKNLYNTFKFNGFLQNKPKEWKIQKTID